MSVPEVSFERLSYRKKVPPDRTNPLLSANGPSHEQSSIRNRLRQWHEEHKDDVLDALPHLFDRSQPGKLTNNLTVSALDRSLQDEGDEVGEETDQGSAYEDQLGGLDVATMPQYLQRGDLVDIPSTSGGGQGLAILIREVDDQSQFYSIQGKWVHIDPQVVSLIVPRFVEPELLEPLLRYLPVSTLSPEMEGKLRTLDVSVPRDVGGPLVRKLLEFSRLAEQAYRDHSTTIDNAHDALAHEHEVRYASLDDVADELFGANPNAKKHPEHLRYALYSAIRHNSLAFGYRAVAEAAPEAIEIRPLRKLRALSRASTWLRAYQEETIEGTVGVVEDSRRRQRQANPVYGFIEKAKQLILSSRKIRTVAADGTLSPDTSHAGRAKGDPDVNYCEAIPTGISFTEDEKAIVEFLEAWATLSTIPKSHPINSLASFLVRAVGMYKDHDFDPPTGFAMLQELGIIPPWEDRVLSKARVGLSRPSSSSAASAEVNSTAFECEASLEPDSMISIRRDWGEMQVYCVDDAGAAEIDDGLSLERIPGSDDTFWIHAHIANPTAFMSPQNPLLREAEHLTETFYLPQRNYPILPFELSTRRFSLAPNRPTLTFSGKVNTEGRLLDHKISSGIVRKVKQITNAELSLVLGEQPRLSTTLTLGGGLTEQETIDANPPDLSASEIADLKQLHGLASALKRLRTPYLTALPRRTEVAVAARAGPQGFPERDPGGNESYFWRGDPMIQVKTKDPSLGTATTEVARTTVEECMILAGQVAAQWCTDRNMAVPYRGKLPSIHETKEERRSRESFIARCERAPQLVPTEWIKYLRAMGRNTIRSRPVVHRLMGATSYVQATSPLRRYGDMLVHWQIEAALRHEARSGESLVGRNTDDCLALSRADIDRKCQRLLYRTLINAKARGQSKRHWLMQFFFRAFYFHQLEMPATFVFEVFGIPSTLRGTGSYVRGALDWLGQAATMSMASGAPEEEIRVGDRYEVRLERVDAYHRLIWVVPIKLLSRADTA
ncbi:MAG: hypothetical protein M1817_003402 [Caeruleum heppii]|nr:MAG: hypothetical protein M1817_003402 [Caeruleum heppii]